MLGLWSVANKERIFVVGIRKDVNSNFKFPEPIPVSERKDLRYAIFDIKDLFETNKILIMINVILAVIQAGI